MVANRSVYVRRGKAYVPMSEQINLVMVEFKNHLIKALEATNKLLPRMEEDDRLKPILLNVEKQYIGRNYDDIGDGTGSITAQEVDSVRGFLHVDTPCVDAHSLLCLVYSSPCTLVYAQFARFPAS